MDKKAYDAQHYPEYSTRVKRVKMTLSPEEYAELQALSSALDIAPAKLAKRLMLAMLRGEKYVPEEAVAELQELRFLLRNIASNMNQIAKHSNCTKQVLDETKAFAYLQEMEEAILAYVKTGDGP